MSVVSHCPRAFALATALVLGATLAGPLSAQSRGPEPICVTGVHLGRDASSPAKKLVLVDGRIEAVLDGDAETPKGMRVIDGEGLLCLPGFVDAYSTTGVETPEPIKDRDVPVDTGRDVRVDMREANRKGVEPEFRAAEALALDKDAAEAWEKAGFGVAQVAPSGQLLSGTSCVVETREGAARDLVLVPDAFDNAAFRATGPGYPSTLMGYIAQLEQFFLDAIRHGELLERQASGRPGPRVAFDPQLDAGVQILKGVRTLLCEAAGHRDAERWFDLADEFSLRLAIVGDGDLWRAADALAVRKVPVVLGLDWGKEVKDPDAEKNKEKEGKATESGEEGHEAEPESAQEPEAAAQPEEGPEAEEPDWEYTEPLDVRRERRRLWEETRDAALVLRRRGVQVCFGTKGQGPDKLLEHVRDLVEAGLDAEDALAVLTTGGAEFLGLGDRLGKVEPGFDATFALWTADPLTEKKAHVAWMFVGGHAKRFELPKDEGKGAEGPPAEGLDVSGSWSLSSTGEDGETIEGTLTLKMEEDGSTTGSIVQPNPMEDGEMEIPVSGQVAGSTLTLAGSTEMQGLSIDFEYVFDVEGDTLSGSATVHIPVMPEPFELSVEGNRNPETH